MLTAVDCQSFAGAFSLGVVNAGFTLAGKRERPGGFGVPAMEGNRHLLGDSWETEVGPMPSWTPLDVQLVFGNPPCSAFSTRSTNIRMKNEEGELVNRGFRDAGNEINQCMWDIVRYAALCDPEVVIFESVQQAGRSEAGRELMRDLWAELKSLTQDPFWTLTHVFHNNLSVGGGSMRKRYFWVASRADHGFGVEPVNIETVPVLEDVIGDLESVPTDGRLEGHVVIDNPRTRRMAQLAGVMDETGDPWRPGEKSGDAYQRGLAEGLSLDFMTSSVERKGSQYAPARMDYDKPAPVMTGKAGIEMVHPTQPRMVTHREVARIIGFPDDWKAAPYIEARDKGMMWWGKGIPVKSGQWIAEWARESILGQPGSVTGEEIEPNEFVIDLTHDWKRCLTYDLV